MLRLDESFSNGVRDVLQQSVVVIGYVQQTARLCVKMQLSPGGNFDDFLESAETSGERDESVGHIRHQRFSFVHRIDDAKFAQSRVQKFLTLQRPRQNSGYVAAGIKVRVGDDPHDTPR